MNAIVRSLRARWAGSSRPGDVWLPLKRRLLRQLGRDNIIAPAAPPPSVTRWQPGAPRPTVVHTTVAPSAGATLTASPGRMPAAAMNCAVSVWWATGDGQTGEVWVSRDGGPEMRFGRGQAGGPVTAPLATTSGYLFNLYTGAECAELRRSVVVLPAPSEARARRLRLPTDARQTAHLARRLVAQRLHIWWYYNVLRRALGRSTRVVWRPPAIAGACARMVCDGTARALARGLSGALGQTGWRDRLRVRWLCCFHHEAELVLLAQTEKISRAWIAAHVRLAGTLPPDGAVMVSVHHPLKWLTLCALDDALATVADVTMEPTPDNTLVLSLISPVEQRMNGALAALYARIGEWHHLRVHRVGREILRYLADGGFPTFALDVFDRRWPRGGVFGTPMPIPRGPVWYAEQSGKPIIPFTLVPARDGWEVWIGDPIPPTQEALARALEACVRQSPGLWRRDHAMAWLQASGQRPL